MTVLGTYDPYLVTLSFAVACLASYTALDLGGRIRVWRGWARLAWLATAAIAMGGGIWSMHFIAMLAFLMPMPVSYDFGLTLLSLVIAIGVTGFGFFTIGILHATALQFLLSGIFMGIGIVSMHYTGMAAMRMPADIHYDRVLVALSVFIAIGASIAALWLAFRTNVTWQRLLAAVVMGSAISGMHYTGMAAATFITQPGVHEARGVPGLAQTDLALSIATITFVILLQALVASAFDRKVSRLAERETALLRESEEQLRHSRMMFETLYEQSPDAVFVVDEIGKIDRVNAQAEALFRLPRERLIGQPIEMLLPERFRDRHLAHRASYMKDARTRPMGSGLELWAQRGDGSEFPVDIMLSPIEIGQRRLVLAVVRDTTERRVAEEALRQSRTMFEKFYEQSPDAIIVVDELGRIDHVNALAEALFGLSRERMVGQSIEMLLPKRFRDRHWAHRTGYMKDAKMRPMGTGLPLFAQRADGSEFPVDIMLSPIEIEQRRMVLAVVRDITERKRAEAQVQLLMNEVNHRAKNILGVVQALAHQTDATSSKEFISRFDERIQSLGASHDLLVKSKWRNVPLAELVRAQLAHFAGLLESRIAVRGPDLRITSAAAQVIGMALHELATNAAKYGALSTAIGCIEIVWGLEEDGAGGDRFTMEWSESGGPIVVTPTRRGFGWTVLCQMTDASLEADVTLKYAPTGVVWHLECPADGVLESEAAE